MHETEEQRLAREAAERRWNIRQLACAALTGLIVHFKPDTTPENPEFVSANREPVLQFSPEQINEMALSAAELAEATLSAIELAEATPAEETLT